MRRNTADYFVGERVRSLLPLICTIMVLGPITVADAKDSNIFSLAGYRLGAYPYEHDEPDLHVNRTKLKKNYLPFDTVITEYRYGRLYQFTLLASTSKNLNAETTDRVVKEIEKQNPWITLSSSTDHPGIYTSRSSGIDVMFTSSSMRLTARFEGQGAFRWFPNGDPFPIPRKTEPIKSLFGVKLGMTVDDILESSIDENGILFIGDSEGTCRFFPKKRFLDFSEYKIHINGSKGVSEIRAKLKRRTKGGKPQIDDEYFNKVVRIFRKRYGIWFTGCKWRAEYYGCGDDMTSLEITHIKSSDYDTIEIRLSANRPVWKREGTIQSNNNTDEKNKAPKENEDKLEREAMEAL